MKTYNYQVSPITENFSSANNGLTLKTYSKVEAINHAKKLKETFKEVSFNVDTYIDNKCTKNEFGYFINENEINFYSVIDYTIKKKSKPLKVNPNMFFDL